MQEAITRQKDVEFDIAVTQLIIGLGLNFNLTEQKAWRLEHGRSCLTHLGTPMLSKKPAAARGRRRAAHPALHLRSEGRKGGEGRPNRPPQKHANC